MDVDFDYTILGAGAVGCVVGGLLSLSGKTVQLINRSDNLARSIKAQGLRLDLDGGEKNLPSDCSAGQSSTTCSSGHGVH